MFYWDEERYPIGEGEQPNRWGVVMLDDTYHLGPVYKLAIYEMRAVPGVVGSRPVAMHVCHGFCESGLTPDAAVERARQYRRQEFGDDGVEFRWVGVLRWSNPDRPVKKGRSK